MIDRPRIIFLGDPGNSPPPEETGRRDALTRREHEILSLISLGKANKEIAEQLAISVRTVEAHRSRIMRKLGIHSHAGLIHYAALRNSAPPVDQKA